MTLGMILLRTIKFGLLRICLVILFLSLMFTFSVGIVTILTNTGMWTIEDKTPKIETPKPDKEQEEMLETKVDIMILNYLKDNIGKLDYETIRTTMLEMLEKDARKKKEKCHQN